MKQSLDEAYYHWLCEQVAVVEHNPSRTHARMLRILYTKEFVWFVPNDDNRLADGRDLRYEFINQSRYRNVKIDDIHDGCSMLELLIGLARRLSFEAEGEPRGWFWQLIENLDLEKYNDNTRLPERAIDDILDQVIFRTYHRSGQGGLFPLQRPHEDQREVELWYQLCAYILERL